MLLCILALSTSSSVVVALAVMPFSFHCPSTQQDAHWPIRQLWRMFWSAEPGRMQGGLPAPHGTSTSCQCPSHSLLRSHDGSPVRKSWGSKCWAAQVRAPVVCTFAKVLHAHDLLLACGAAAKPSRLDPARAGIQLVVSVLCCHVLLHVVIHGCVDMSCIGEPPCDAKVVPWLSSARGLAHGLPGGQCLHLGLVIRDVHGSCRR